MTSSNTMPDAGTTDIEAMTLQEIEAELRSYEPATAAAVAHGDEHRERRARLWRRLDELSGVRRPAAAAPPQRGGQHE
jgi:hypothetical protein